MQIGRSPPKDQTVRIIEHSQVNLTIYAILASCSILGIILATVFLGFNIKYRNQRYVYTLLENKILFCIIRIDTHFHFLYIRYIKMSSPHLNNLIILGCMCTYLSVIFLGLDSGLSSIAAFPYGNYTKFISIFFFPHFVIIKLKNYTKDYYFFDLRSLVPCFI